jgi:tetratricopeptide (TPR) repeat protein
MRRPWFGTKKQDDSAPSDSGVDAAEFLSNGSPKQVHTMFRRIFLLFLVVTAGTAIASAKTDSWLEVGTPHFIVLSNSSERQARHVADQLEQMRSVFRKAFPGTEFDPSSPIIAIAVKDENGFRALEPEVYLAKGQATLAGLFVGGPDKNYILLRLDVAGFDRPYATVYHEYTHFVLRSQTFLPLWLVEGFAEFYETTEMKDKEVATGQASTEKLVFLKQKQLLPLATLLTVDYNSPYYHEEDKTSVFYAESWALTHYLQVKDRQDKTHRLLDYATLMSRKVDSLTAATKVFGDLKALQKSLEQYISLGYFTYFKLPSATEVDESAFKVQTVTATQADAVRAGLLVYDRRTNDARTLLDRVLKEDPDNVAGHETLGLLAFREGKMDEAEKWYGQAVKLDSQNFLVHYYYALILMRQGMSGGRAAQIEASLRAATKLNPSFAPAFDQLAAFYGMRDTNLEEAHMLGITAVQLEPSNLNFRLNVASVLMQMQRPKDSIAVLKAALKYADGPEQVSAIRGRMDSIEKSQTAHERHEEPASAQSRVQDGQELTAPADTPTQPDDGQHGARRTVRGTLAEVHCSRPATLNLKVTGTANPLVLRAANYYKVGFSVLNFTPSGDLNPCKDLEGMKAKVEYFEGLNSPAEGQIISIELTK